MMPGEGEAIAAYVQQNMRIPRRGEVGWTGDEIEGLETQGCVQRSSSLSPPALAPLPLSPPYPLPRDHACAPPVWCCGFLRRARSQVPRPTACPPT